MVGINELNRTYQPINSYGIIGDCHSVVLVAPDGSVDWGCLPDFDSPAIFCRLLDAERGGYFQIGPSDGAIPGSQRYMRGSNVLQTCFTSIMGEIVLTDFMPVKTLSAWPYKGMDNNTWTARGWLLSLLGASCRMYAWRNVSHNETQGKSRLCGCTQRSLPYAR